ncbi:non-oxidative hydroxyarylic acid decarboxylases subunit D [Spongorhabdus nitratireducens]
MTQCVRCGKQNAEVMTEASDKSWILYSCPDCRYAWRTTEVVENRTREQFPKAFQWTDETMKSFTDFPRITTRKNKQ